MSATAPKKRNNLKFLKRCHCHRRKVVYALWATARKIFYHCRQQSFKIQNGVYVELLFGRIYISCFSGRGGIFFLRFFGFCVMMQNFLFLTQDSQRLLYFHTTVFHVSGEILNCYTQVFRF